MKLKIAKKEFNIHIKTIHDMVSIFTPDVKQLERKQRHLIFVCDDLMSGNRNSDLIVETSVSGRWPLMNGYTQDKFFFWKKELGELSFPVALDKDVTGFYHGNSFDKSSAKIHGEIYGIRTAGLIRLDIDRENTVQFTRRRVNIRIPYIHGASKFPDIEVITVWMYVGNHEYWDDQLAGVHASRPIEKTHDDRVWLEDHYRFK